MSWTEAATEQTIDACFRRQAAATPEHRAIAGTDEPLRYRDLDALASRYAAAMLARVERPRRVALLLGQGSEVVAAALAVLRAGAAVVTVNPADPPARIASIRERTSPDLVVTTGTHADRARASGVDPERMLDLASAADADAAEVPVTGEPDDPAFLISTSGSTGAPKVVVQTHRNVLHNVLRYANGLGVEEGDRLALLAALSGGQGLATTWSALLNGAALCPFPLAERGVTGLADWLEETGVTIFDTVPSVLRNFALTLRGRRLDGIRLVRLASEAASRSDFDAFTAHYPEECRLAHVLASSECGVIAQALYSADDDPRGGRLPVGVPAEGVDVVLDGDGDEGEILVRSRWLSPGYWGDEELTAQRFETVDGVRQFRSGDLGRLRGDGMLVVLGRADAQVKIRGHRLQLEEVEVALAAQPGVAAAAAAVTTTPRGDARLTAFLVAAESQEPTPAQLRASLRLQLPAHAIPAAFVWLDTLPVTPHGKIDRERLAAPDESERPVGGSDFLTQTEEILQGLWSDVLEREDVGREDGFLDLGGDSLAAATIGAGIREVFGVEVGLADFAENHTLAELAEVIDGRSPEPPEPAGLDLRRVRRPGPLSFAQLRFWRQERRSASPSRWNVVVPFRLRGPLDVEAFRRSAEALVARHEILRTGYVERDGRRWAIVRETQPVEIEIDDLRREDDPERLADELAERERLRPFDLEHGPLLRLRLIRVADEEYRLLRLTHHMIHDAASWTILFRELALEYEAALEGRDSPLPEPPALQYIDYASWERRSARPQSPRYQQEVAFWARQYADAPAPPRLPFARAEGDEETDGRDVVRWGLSSADVQRLTAIGRAAGATHYMTRLAAFAALVGLETGVEDLLLGTPLTARTRPELQTMVGPFINYRSLRLSLRPEASFEEHLTNVRGAVIEMSNRSRIPWEQLVRELRRREVPLTPVAASFAAWNSVTELRFGGLHLEALPRPCGDSRGFRVGVNRHYEADRCWADFDPRGFDADGVAAFVRRLEVFLGRIAAEPSRPVHELHESLPSESTATRR